ncbi:hypothetical protein EYE40_07565 [Glaciihabitans arcticus]|uniref:Uncharacterized protein n=1 Tax=Glaciihabitans arcticus TaxID=2668039 RepID=A0A4Q9GQU4_9MICO|nr:hypothetical protein [Glaciihabitans arcticus]TBN57266.1 hypothetical protein EYE40_07565 [Glaciihabitans arcticus]
MSAGQRRQLNKIAAPITALLAELDPHIIDPSREKQKALGIADATMLLRVGIYRVITVFAVDRDSWNVKEFDSESGQLVQLHDRTAKVPDSEVPLWVLKATVSSIESQLEAYRTTGFATAEHEQSYTVLGRLLAVLQNRVISNTPLASVGAPVTGSTLDDDDQDDY